MPSRLQPNGPCNNGRSEEDPEYLRAFEEVAERCRAGENIDDETLERDYPRYAQPLKASLPTLKLLSAIGAQERGTESLINFESLAGPSGRDLKKVEAIGQGGMGIVFKVRQESLGKDVALKFLPPLAAIDPQRYKLFLREATAAASLDHEHIVPILFGDPTGPSPYYAMKYIEGHSLAEILRALRRRVSGTGDEDDETDKERQASLAQLLERLIRDEFAPGKVRPDTSHNPSATHDNVTTAAEKTRLRLGRPYIQAITRLGLQAGQALQHAHGRAVIHRDVKPANLILDGEGHLWLTDFGLALLKEDEATQLSSPGAGTRGYSSPEQRQSEPTLVDLRTDIYSLGATLYELLTLKRPRTLPGGDSIEALTPLRRLNREVPRDLETICMKCLEEDPAKRYQSALALADDLGRFLDDRPIVARRVTTTERLLLWRKRNWRLSAALAALVFVTLGGLVTVTWLWREARKHEARALSERNRAEKNLGRVLDGFDRWYMQLADRPELKREDLRPLRGDLLTSVRDELDCLAKEVGSNPRLKREHIKATVAASHIRFDLKESGPASSLSRAAIEEAESLLRDHPDSAEFQESLFGALHRGLIQETNNTRVPAMLHRAEEIFEKLARQESLRGRTNRYRALMSLNAYNVAFRMLGQGQEEEATRLFHQSCELGEALLHEEKNREVARALVASYSYLCDMESAQNRRAEAERALRRSHEVVKKLLIDERGSAQSLVDYLISCEQLQGYLSDWGRQEAAMACARDLCQTLEEAGNAKRPEYEKPSIARWLLSSYHMLIRQGRRYREVLARSDPTQAERLEKGIEATCLKAEKLSESLRILRTDDADSEYQGAVSCFELFHILKSRKGQSEQAGRYLARGCELMESSLRKQPNEDRRKEFQAFQEVRDRVARKRQ